MVSVPKVILITPPWSFEALSKVLEPIFELPFEQGALALMLRDKAARGRDFFLKAKKLRILTLDASVSFLVNQRLDVACLVEADGVHLPERGFLPAQVRKLLGEAALVGVSCHDQAGLQNAEINHSNYAFLGPIFKVPTKNTPLGFNQFNYYAKKCKIPVLALGGVGPNNVEELYFQNTAGVGVIRSVFESPDPQKVVHHLLRCFGGLREEA